MNTELKYRTLDQLLNEVAADFTTYSLEGFIEPSQLIKVVQEILSIASKFETSNSNYY